MRFLGALRASLTVVTLLTSSSLGLGVGLSGCSTGTSTAAAPGPVGGPAGTGGTANDPGATCVGSPTDPSNCGTCGRSCGAGACTSGVCQPYVLAPVASVGERAHSLTTDAARVYWLADDGSGQGYERPSMVEKRGGAAKAFASLPGPNEFSRAFAREDHLHVYTSSCCVGENVWSLDSATGTTTAAGGASGADQLRDAWLGGELALYVGDPRVYAARFDATGKRHYVSVPNGVRVGHAAGNDTSFFFSIDDAIQRVEKSAFTFPPNDSDVALYVKPAVVRKVTGLALLAADGTDLVAFSHDGASTWSVSAIALGDKGLTPLTTFAGEWNAVTGMVLTDDVITWSVEVGTTGTIFRMAKTGGTPSELASYTLPKGILRTANRIAVDETRVYFSSDAGLMAVTP